MKCLNETAPGLFEPVEARGEPSAEAIANGVAACAQAGGHSFVSVNGRCVRCGGPKSEKVTKEPPMTPAIAEPALTLAAPPLPAPGPYQPRDAPLEDDDDDTTPGKTLGWHIETLAGVESSLSRMRVLEMRKLQNEEIAEVAIARVKRWLAKQNAGIEWGIGLHAAKIEEFAVGHRDEVLLGAKKGTKSRSFPSGRVGWRKKGGGYHVTDSKALLDWARAKPVEEGLVRIKEEPALDEIKRYAEKGSVVPPGMTLEDGEDEFEVKPLKVSLLVFPKEDSDGAL